MKATKQTSSKPSNHEIADAAYQIWEKEGKPDGRAEEHWFEAEAHLTSGTPIKPAKSANAKVAAKTSKSEKTKPQSRYGLVLNDSSAAS